MDKDKVYAICGDKNWQETMTKQQIESAINTSANTIESNIEIKTYSDYNQVPNCQGVGDMRTVAQNMAKPGILVKYVNDGNLPGGGNGVLTIRTNTTSNTAIFMFESVTSQQTYVCHFFAEDSSNWIKTAMTWVRVLDSDVIPHYARFVDAGYQDVTIPANNFKIITATLTPTNIARVVIPNANMHIDGDSSSPRPIIINAMLSDVNKYNIVMYNPFDFDVTGRVSWRTIVDYPAL